MRLRMNVVLWIVQGLLALLFLFAGGMKLVLPVESLAGPIPLPGLFIRFIGVAEVLGAIGLILAWKIAGYYGADRYLLRFLGTPWGRDKPNVPVGEAHTTLPVRT